MSGTALIIDGKTQAQQLRAALAQEIAALPKAPALAVIIVGHDPASEVYVRNKIKACEEVGIRSLKIPLQPDITEATLIAEIEALNHNPDINGILLQLPLPSHLDGSKMIGTIAPEKDVDGFHLQHMGRLVTGQTDGQSGGATPSMISCTPMGCMLLLKSAADALARPLAGQHAVVIGRSNIVGKPVSLLLLQADCTVTIAHSKTQNLPDIIRQGDIVIAALGRPHFVKAAWLKPGAIVIDVGINRVTHPDGTFQLVGDVEYDAARQVAAAITPVPGGVGPMTIACLLHNSLQALRAQQK